MQLVSHTVGVITCNLDCDADRAAAEPHYADPAAEAAAARELQEEREIQQEREARRGRNRNDPGNVSTFARSDRGAPEV